MLVHFDHTCFKLKSDFKLGLAAMGSNQAVGRPVYESSSWPVSAFSVSFGVDGITDRCSHTNLGEPPPQWWMVDLQRDISISSVVLYNRIDCCSKS